MLILFVILYNRLSRPINRIQTEAAKTGQKLDNDRELQASWDRVLLIRGHYGPNLPRLNGVEAASQIRRMLPDTKVIGFTTLSDCSLLPAFDLMLRKQGRFHAIAGCNQFAPNRSRLRRRGQPRGLMYARLNSGG